MKDFFDKETYTEKDIDSLIDNQVEESLNLEFKNAFVLSKEYEKKPEKKHEFSKDISAFANSNGGIIIYGVNEKEHVAKGKSYVDGNEITKERLEQIISSQITRKIPNLTIHPIRCNNNIEETIYLIKIPESDSSPHMAMDKKYYRRYNFMSVPMAEYEVRNLYYKTRFPKLEILPPVCSEEINVIFNRRFNSRFDDSSGNYVFKFRVKNVAQLSIDKCKVEVLIPDKFIPDYNMKELYNSYPNLKINQTTGYHQFINYFEQSIFPFTEEVVFSCGLNFSFPSLSSYRDLEKYSISVHIFYNGGLRSIQYSIPELLRINQNKDNGLTTLYKDMDIG